MSRVKQANALIAALHRARKNQGSVTLEAAQSVAAELRLPLSEVLAAATFFSAFNGMDDGQADDRFLVSTVGEGRPELIMGHPSDYPGVRRMMAENIDMLDWIRRAKLRGKSGSGFPLADKWELTMKADAEEKYIVCNGSEGEGDTYKDYFLMVNKPQMVIEGMLICALTAKIEQGYLYVRAEYDRAFQAVDAAIRNAYAKGVLGENALGSGMRFELEAVLGGGAYVSGEETALLEMLEGHRSEPRLKPPFPGVSGLFGKPTILNNVESFAAVASLAKNGVDAFLEQGTDETGGTKLFTLSGYVQRPGVYELPHRATVAEALVAAGGAPAGAGIKGFQVGGGATGSFGTWGQLDTVLDYGPMRSAGLSLGTAAIRFISSDESVPGLALRSTAFLKDQSCGVCTACRYGLVELTDLLTRLCEGKGTAETLARAKSMCGYVGQDARCALGQAAPTAFLTALRAFPEEFEALCGEEASHEYYTL